MSQKMSLSSNGIPFASLGDVMNCHVSGAKMVGWVGIVSFCDRIINRKVKNQYHHGEQIRGMTMYGWGEGRLLA